MLRVPITFVPLPQKVVDAVEYAQRPSVRQAENPVRIPRRKNRIARGISGD